VTVPFNPVRSICACPEDVSKSIAANATTMRDATLISAFLKNRPTRHLLVRMKFLPALIMKSTWRPFAKSLP
jgi:hypothetical protein